MKKLFFTSILSLFVLVSISAADKQAKEEAQNITGRVVELVDGKLEPVPFVLVSCPGTTVSAFTNENGEFELAADTENKLIRLSYAGYNVKEVEVKADEAGAADFNITKQEIQISRAE